MKKYDVIVIGGGPGGYVAAIRAASRGAKTALVEKDTLGGCCLNVGCIPTKAILHIAELVDSLADLKGFGITADASALDYSKVKAYKDKAVLRLTKGVEFLMKNHNIEVYKGTASFVDNRHLKVTGADGEETLQYEKAIIASGGEPIVPPVFKKTGCNVMTSTDALDLEKLPASIAVVGGGYIGCEFASALAAFGVEVTIVEMLAGLIPAMDPDLSKELTRAFKKRKIGMRFEAQVEGVEKKGDKAVLKIKGGDDLTVDAVLIAIGRKPNAVGLGLENVGITPDKRGAIPVDEFCATERPGIYAIGDVTGRILLAHVASAQARVAAANCTGGSVKMDYRVVPAALFTTPEIASVGATEAAAKEQGRDCASVSFPYRGLGRAVASDAADGFMKLVYDTATRELLGAHLVGANASDLIAVCAYCMKTEGTLEELSETIFVHPTFAEGIMEAAEAGLGHGIHGA